MLQVSNTMLRSYFRGFLSNVIDDQGPMPPTDLANCDRAIEDLHDGADGSGDLEYLKLGLALMLSDPTSKPANWRFGHEGGWPKDELQRVFAYAYRKMFP